MLADSELRAQLSDAAQESLEDITVRRISSETIGAYTEALQPKRVHLPISAIVKAMMRHSHPKPVHFFSPASLDMDRRVIGAGAQKIELEANPPHIISCDIFDTVLHRNAVSEANRVVLIARCAAEMLVRSVASRSKLRS